MKWLSPSLILILSLSLSACSPTNPNPGNDNGDSKNDPRVELVKEGWNYYLQPALADLKEKTATLKEVSAKYCDNSGATLDQVKTAWGDAFKALNFQEVYSFGPYRNYSKARTQLDTWPVDESFVKKFIYKETKGGKKITSDAFTAASSKTVGFPVMEYLIWDTENPIQPGDDRCDYLKSISELAVTDVNELYDGWVPEKFEKGKPVTESSPGFYYTLLHPGVENGRYRDSKIAAEEIVNRTWFILGNLVEDKLGKPLGEASSKKEPLPKLAEARFSGMGIDAIRANVEGVKKCYIGREGHVSISGIIAKTDPQLDADVKKAIENIFTKLDAVTLPLQEAVVQENDKVKEVNAALKKLQVLIETDVLGKLGLNTHQRDADGD